MGLRDNEMVWNAVSDSEYVPNFGERYAPIGIIGAGSMGAIYLAYDTVLEIDVAIKTVPALPQRIEPLDCYRDALSREYGALSSLCYPHIVRVYEMEENEAELPFFTMKYLHDVVDIRRKCVTSSFYQKMTWLVELLQTASYLHDHEVIHRDLKPENIMIENNSVILIDFGLALHIDETDNCPTSGTIAYMAPEVLLGDAPSFASDMYAIGLVAYEMLTGQPMFGTGSIQGLVNDILNKPIDADLLHDCLMFSRNCSIPDSRLMLIDVIARMTAKEPNARYAHPDHVLHDIYAALENEMNVQVA